MPAFPRTMMTALICPVCPFSSVTIASARSIRRVVSSDSNWIFSSDSPLLWLIALGWLGDGRYWNTRQHRTAATAMAMNILTLIRMTFLLLGPSHRQAPIQAADKGQQQKQHDDENHHNPHEFSDEVMQSPPEPPIH